VQVIEEWLNGSTIKNIKESCNLSLQTVSEMAKHFRELCQSNIVKTRPMFGGPAERVLVKVLKICTEPTCNILFLIDESLEKGFLLHNSDGRYLINGNENIPVVEGSILCSNLNLKDVVGCTIMVENVYRKEFHLAINHALTWLRSKRGIKCSKMGGYINEYNFRFCVDRQGNDGDRFLRAFQNVYEHIN